MQLKQNINLYKYQQEIVDWMRNIKENSVNGSRGGILYVDMGLGKTFTTLEYLRQSQSKKALIVCSKTLIQEWMKQIEKFYEKKPKVLIYHSSFNSKLKNLKRTDIESYDIVITTYHMVSKANKVNKDTKYSDNLIYKEEYMGKLKWKISDYEEFKFRVDSGKGALYGIEWDNVICDESQTITNWKTSFFQSIYTLNTQAFFGLSGTPIKNNKAEFITSLKLLKVDGQNYPCMWNKVANIIREEYFQLFYTVTYKTAQVKLPQVNNIVKELEFSTLEKKILERYVGLWEFYMGVNRDDYGEVMTKLLGLFTRLRQINLDKMLLVKTNSGKFQYIQSIIKDRGEDPTMDLSDDYIKNFNHGLTFGNQKFEEIKKIIKEVKYREEKVIIFSSFTTYLKLLVENLKDKKITFIESEDSIQTRSAKIKMWQETQDKHILIMNYRIGAEGLNLVEANNVVLLDTWWNFTYEKQAIARCHRIGQTKQVNVYRLLFKNSVETLMFNKSAFKSDIFNKIKNNDKLNDLDSSLSLKNMNEIVRSLRTGLRTFELNLEILDNVKVEEKHVDELGDLLGNMKLDVQNHGECSICLEDIKDDLETTTCYHKFHHSCLIEWKSINNCCPICRDRI